MNSWQSQQSGAQASMLLNSILKAEFFEGLICLREVSTLLQPVSLALQAVGTDLVQALNNIDVTLSVLRQWRSQCETTFSKLFAEVTAMASDLDVQVSKPRTAKRSVYRSNACWVMMLKVITVLMCLTQCWIRWLLMSPNGLQLINVSQCSCVTSCRTMHPVLHGMELNQSLINSVHICTLVIVCWKMSFVFGNSTAQIRNQKCPLQFLLCVHWTCVQVQYTQISTNYCKFFRHCRCPLQSPKECFPKWIWLWQMSVVRCLKKGWKLWWWSRLKGSEWFS